MTTDNPDLRREPDEPAEDHAVLAEAETVHTTGIGIVGFPFTAQVPVTVASGTPDDFDDDGVVDDEPLPDAATSDVPVIEAVIDEGTAERPFGDEVAGSRPHDAIEPAGHESVADGSSAHEPNAHEPNAHDGSAALEAPAPVAAAAPLGAPAALESPTVVAAASAAAPAPTTTAAAVSATTPAADTTFTATDSAPVPTTRRAAHHTGSQERVHEMERVHPPRREVSLTSRRLGEFDATSESSDLLTADRLLDRSKVSRPEPEGRWQHFVYTISGRRINLGDSRSARARKELDRRIAAPLTGECRFVPVLSRKGGVGKTTVTTLLGMALADARDDRIIAIDANPDRGTLAERIARPSGRTVRDLARHRDEIHGYNDVSTIVTRDETRLDVLASDADPRVSEAFSDRDYHDVAALAAHYYSIVLTDTGTGIVHSVMGATLELADQLVVVAGLSVDEARLASETLTWLETNGFAEQVRNAVVVLNNSRPGPPLVHASELDSHFRTRVRAVVHLPYDPQIATGSAIAFGELQPATRAAARQLAAAVVEGLRSLASAA